MTAINAIIKRKVAYLLTDTAVYDRDGIVRGFASKVMAVPHLGMAIATRGPYAMLGVLGSEVALEFSTFSDFVSRCPDFLRSFQDRHFNLFAEAGETEFDLVAVGWCEREQASYAVTISSRDYSETAGGSLPFTISRHVAAFGPSPTTEMFKSHSVRPGALLSGDPETSLLKLAEIQRQASWPIGSGGSAKGHIVGGGAILAVVGEQGIQMRCVHRWPDTVGQKISLATENVSSVVSRPAQSVGSLFSQQSA